MLFQFALRNVLRNKKRSFLTASSIFVATLVICLLEGWLNGILGAYIDSTARYQSGHIRVMKKEYYKRERFLPVDEYIPNTQRILKKLKKITGVTRCEERIRFGLLLAHQQKTVYALGLGINFTNNSLNIRDKVYNRHGEKIAFKPSGVYIGKELAKKLNVTTGQTLKLVTRKSTQGLNGIKLKVSGIVTMGVAKFDEKFFFIDTADAKRLLKLDSDTTEILVFTKKYNQAPQIQQKIKKMLPAEIIAPTLQEQNKNLYQYFQNMRVLWYIINSVIIFLASFIIINTMMMAIFERIREIGTLKALGLNQKEIFLNFTLEGAIIGAAGGLAGTIVGGIIVAIVSHTGINLESSMKGIDLTIEYIVYPAATFATFFTTFILATIIPALAAMIPARYTKKLQPAEALRKT